MYPEIAYNRLFGSVARGQARNSFTARRNLLQHMQQDIKRVRDELGAIERGKLDADLSAFEALGTKSQRLIEVTPRIVGAFVAILSENPLGKRLSSRRPDGFLVGR